MKKYIKEITLAIVNMIIYSIAYSVFEDKKLEFFVLALALIIVNEIYILSQE